jgi:hypothetical protein
MSYIRHDFYSDDPIEEISSPIKRKFSSILAFLLLLVGGTYFVQTTLAANIAINTGAPVEFGQGVSATTACSGATNLTITPNSSFVNASGGGAHYFSSVTVSNIPSSCNGKDFTINAFGNTSSAPLAIFNSTSTSAVVYSNAGTFELGAGTLSGASITSGSGTFTLTFITPVATSGSVFKVTLQSGEHVALPSSCVQGITCSIGDVGPGGGNIFYYSAAGFSCGSGFTSIGSPTNGLCHYLEAAPSTWGSGTFPYAVSPHDSSDISNAYGISNDTNANSSGSTIGLGYKNSIAIVTQNGAYNSSTNKYAAGAARSYSGGSKSDWYLPNFAELNQMCKWARGVAWTSDSTICSGGTLNLGTGDGLNAAGFESNFYWSSSERENSNGWGIYFGSPLPDYLSKFHVRLIRPIRAF